MLMVYEVQPIILLIYSELYYFEKLLILESPPAHAKSMNGYSDPIPIGRFQFASLSQLSAIPCRLHNGQLAFSKCVLMAYF